MKNVIPYGKQHITSEAIEDVVKVLRSDYLTQGPRVNEFESSFSNYIGVKYAIAVSNGTAALHLSLLSLGVGKGDRVITTPITFAASANAVRYCGGEVEFSDIDSENYLLDFEKVKRLIESKPKGYFKGIIPVDFSGRAINLEKFKLLAIEHDLWILEDSCHAPGGYFIDSNGIKQKCGNGNFADLAIFSFHPVKHIATGEGGMITTNSEQLYKKLLTLRTHGITKEPEQFQNSIKFAGGENEYPGWYMEMQDLGFNYRLTDIQAAIGLSQIKQGERGLKKRNQIAEIYYKALKGKDFIKSQSGIKQGHAYHLYVIEVENRLGLYNHLHKNGILAQIHYIPCHLMPYYRKLGWKEGDMPNAESYYKNCISLPMFPTLTEEEHQFVIDKIISFYNE